MIEARELTKMWSATAGLRPVSFTVEPGDVGPGGGIGDVLADGQLDGQPEHLGHQRHSRPRHRRRGHRAGDNGRTGIGRAQPTEQRQQGGLAAARTPPHHDQFARLDGLLDRLDLRGFADRGIDEVSMGQQQRAAVARALVQVPSVLLVDEPTSYQDGGHALATVDELRSAAAEGCAVLVATHDDAVVAAAHRVLELHAV